MSVLTQTRASSTPADQTRTRPDLAVDHIVLQSVAQHMYALMLRNVATDGFPFVDSTHTAVSVPGCVIAAPSYPANAPGISQDYVFNWVRDAAITAFEIVAATSSGPEEAVQELVDYVNFAQLCQSNATPTMGHACYTVNGYARPWSEQNDGPAIQTSAVLAAFPKLDAQAQDVARGLVGRNVEYLLTCYQDATTNLWEEHRGFSFFARSIQLRCFREVSTNPYGIDVPAGTAEAISWLEDALAAHWTGTHYATMLGGESPGQLDQPIVPPGYDPNIDIVQACVYGAVSCTDPKLLATAGLLIAQWADPDSPEVYPVNVADAQLGLGPLLGRYPGDIYDGGSDSLGRHPWPLCTANFAQLYYELANAITGGSALPLDDLSAPFFAQIGVTADTPLDVAVEALQVAGDAMLRAVVYHSDHLELSEQFDGESGYEKSVRDLTWSYASFLSAVRARTGLAVEG
ncbi:glucoamylase [Friedmanniella luteola]|uniref:glucan 1,4-alpha-glucosidase n=1 Tax=Friedmanniella luteola TaxID=546871 RepID=A0A1H2A7H9_9ACTN|nr:glycoside hydrolase family 15 protein [Friedmanniella luteola]SDT41827.1 glucoamylase [Friedmanniella luteola]